jgi:predicted transcriptional regulator
MADKQPPTQKPVPSVIVGVRLPRETRDALAVIAERDDRSISWLLRQAAVRIVQEEASHG